MSLRELMIGIHLPLERDGTLPELLETGGLRPTDGEDAGRLIAHWPEPGLRVEVVLEETEFNRIIWMYLSQSSWLRLTPDDDSGGCPQEADGGMALVWAMRTLCKRLAPEAAMFFSRLWQNRAWWEEHEWTVPAKRVEYLLGLGPAILYVNDEMAEFLDDRQLHLEKREIIPTTHGLMVLAGTGRMRFI